MFCDRHSGAVRFHVQAAPGGTLPVEQAASLLAMHCLARRQVPCDYAVLVVPREALLDPVSRRAQELLNVGRAIGPEVRVTPREREVLECVVRGLANKQIAACLSVSERTVKFHVSALLQKFEVSDRVDLIREAMNALLPASAPPTDTLFGFSVPTDLQESRPWQALPAPSRSALPVNRPVGPHSGLDDDNLARRSARSL